MKYLSDTIDNIWKLLCIFLPNGLARTITFILLLISILIISKFRDKKWHVPVWLVLLSFSVVPFMMGIKFVSYGIPRDTIVPGVIFIPIWYAITLLPSYPLILLTIFYPRKQALHFPVIIFTLLVIGCLSYIARSSAEKSQYPLIYVRSETPDGMPIPNFPLRLDISNWKASPQERYTREVNTDQNGIAKLPEWDFKYIFIRFGEKGNETEYFIDRSSAQSNDGQIIIQVQWPYIKYENNDILQNNIYYKVKDTHPFSIVITVPSNEKEPRYEMKQYAKLLAENPDKLRASSGYGFPKNILLLQNKKIIKDISNNYIRSDALSAARDMLDRMHEIIRSDLGTYRSTEIPTNEEYRTAMNGISVLIRNEPINLNNDSMNNRAQLFKLMQDIENERTDWRE